MNPKFKLGNTNFKMLRFNFIKMPLKNNKSNKPVISYLHHSTINAIVIEA